LKKKLSTGKNRKPASHPFDRSIKPLSPAQRAKLPGLKVLRASATEASGYVAPPPQEKVLRSTPILKRKFEKAKQKEHYTLKQLPIPPQKNFVGYVKYIESHSDELDKLLRTGEYWAASYKGNKTHTLYDHISKLMEDLNKYDDSQRFGKTLGKKENLVQKVQILKFKGSTGKRGSKAKREYQKIKQEEIDARKESQSKREAKQRAARKRAEKRASKAEAREKKLREENKRLRAEAKKHATKRTKKGVTKKTTKVSKPAKKTAAKKSPTKPKAKKTVAPKKQVKKSKPASKPVKKSRPATKPSKKGKRKS
jgi:hypothetical protein